MASATVDLPTPTGPVTRIVGTLTRGTVVAGTRQGLSSGQRLQGTAQRAVKVDRLDPARPVLDSAAVGLRGLALGRKLRPVVAHEREPADPFAAARLAVRAGRPAPAVLAQDVGRVLVDQDAAVAPHGTGDMHRGCRWPGVTPLLPKAAGRRTARSESYCWRAPSSAASPCWPRTRARCSRYITFEDWIEPPDFLYPER